MAAMKRVLAGVGGAAVVAAVVLAGCEAKTCKADPTPINPSLPTFFTDPQTYIVQGNGLHTDCVAIDQALSCPTGQQ